MTNFTILIRELASIVCDFLLTEPITYFLGIIMLFNVIALFRYAIYGEGR